MQLSNAAVKSYQDVFVQLTISKDSRFNILGIFQNQKTLCQNYYLFWASLIEETY